MTLVEVKDDKLEIKPVRLRKEKYKTQLKNKIFNEDDLYLFHEGRNYNAYETGLWSIFIPRLKEGIKYKYYIEQEDGKAVLKADPYGIYSEVRPNTASILCEKTKKIFFALGAQRVNLTPRFLFSLVK